MTIELVQHIIVVESTSMQWVKGVFCIGFDALIGYTQELRYDVLSS